MTMDNFRIDITSEGRDTFNTAVALAFQRASVARRYAVIQGCLVLFWTDDVPANATLTRLVELPWKDREAALVEKGPYNARLVVSERRVECIPVESHPLFAMKPEAAADFAWHWLEQAPLGPEPDHDGDNDRGWHLFNEAWGHVFGMWQAFVAVRPVWAMYGK